MRVTVSEEGTLLDHLKKMQPSTSNNVLRKMLTNQRVQVDESVIYRAKHIVQSGQIIEILPRPKLTVEEKQEVSAKEHDLDIIHEDEHILVVSKPAGLLSVATNKLERDTLHNRCVEYCKTNDRRGWCFIVHRLDKATSGIMIFAKNENSKRYLQEQFSERQVHRQYVALVEGIAEDGAVTHHLIEDKTLRVHISEKKTKESKVAITSWQVMKSNDIATLLHVLIETGRRHQIRVALADHGTPVAGDRMHGAENNLYGRICLHATALEFLHPFDDEPVRFESEYDPAWNHGLKNP